MLSRNSHFRCTYTFNVILLLCILYCSFLNTRLSIYNILINEHNIHRMFSDYIYNMILPKPESVTQ